MGGEHIGKRSPSVSGKGMIASLKKAENKEKSSRKLVPAVEEEEAVTEPAPPPKKVGILGKLRGGGGSETQEKQSKKDAKEEEEAQTKKDTKKKKSKDKKEKKKSTEGEPFLEPTERIQEEVVKERRSVGQRLRGTSLWNKTLDLNHSFKDYRTVRARKKPDHDHQLHDACAAGDMERVKYLLIKHGGKVNELYREHSPLQYAIKKEQVEMVRYLVNDQFAQIGAGFHGGAFMTACEIGNQEILEFLHKARPASPTHDLGIFRLTPLMIAADRGHVKVCKYLVKQGGVDVNVTNSYGYDALHCAAAKGHADIVKFLAKVDADGLAVCNTGETALHRAIMFHHVDTFEFLMERYPQSVHVKNKKGETPVDLARKHHPASVAALEKKAKKIPNPFLKPPERKTPLIKNKIAAAAKRAALLKLAAGPAAPVAAAPVTPTSREAEIAALLKKGAAAPTSRETEPAIAALLKKAVAAPEPAIAALLKKTVTDPTKREAEPVAAVLEKAAAAPPLVAAARASREAEPVAAVPKREVSFFGLSKQEIASAIAPSKPIDHEEVSISTDHEDVSTSTDHEDVSMPIDQVNLQPMPQSKVSPIQVIPEHKDLVPVDTDRITGAVPTFIPQVMRKMDDRISESQELNRHLQERVERIEIELGLQGEDQEMAPDCLEQRLRQVEAENTILWDRLQFLEDKLADKQQSERMGSVPSKIYSDEQELWVNTQESKKPGSPIYYPTRMDAGTAETELSEEEKEEERMPSHEESNYHSDALSFDSIDSNIEPVPWKAWYRTGSR